LIAIVYIGIIKGKMPGQLTGFLFGLFWDTFSLIDTFGLRILIFTVIGYFSSELSKNFNGNKIFTQLTIIFFLNIFYSLYFYFICYNTNKTLYFLIQKSIEIFTTMLICPLFFYILKFYI
jgi:rod shape-determining protein MreD